MPDSWIGLVITGIVAGIFSGLFGIGGGLVIVPILIVFVGFTTIEAVSTSLAALLLPVGILAVLTYYRAKLIDLRASVWMALGLITTSAVGAMGALQIDALNPDLMKQIYGIFLLYMSWRFIEPRKVYREYQQAPTEKVEKPAETLENPQPEWYELLGIGLFAGVLSGMFGIGGGVVIVPFLVMALNYEQKRAVGTSLGALLFPVGLPGVLVYAEDGVLDLPVAMLVAVGLLFGSIVGARIALNLSTTTMRRLYGIFILLAGLRFIFG